MKSRARKAFFRRYMTSEKAAAKVRGRVPTASSRQHYRRSGVVCPATAPPTGRHTMMDAIGVVEVSPKKSFVARSTSELTTPSTLRLNHKRGSVLVQNKTLKTPTAVNPPGNVASKNFGTSLIQPFGAECGPMKSASTRLPVGNTTPTLA